MSSVLDSVGTSLLCEDAVGRNNKEHDKERDGKDICCIFVLLGGTVPLPPSLILVVRMMMT